MNRQWIALAVVAGACLGCNGGGSSGAGESGGPAGSKELKIVYIPKNTGNPYFDDVIRGFQDAAKDLKCSFTTVGPATPDATLQIPIVKQQIQRGVDVIAISPDDPDRLTTVLDDARKHGIVVITVDADVTGHEASRDACVLPADPQIVAQTQVDLMAKMLGGKGTFAILSATPDAPNQNEWIADMKEILKGPKYSGLTLVGVVFGDDKDDKSTTECEALIAKYPALNGIEAPTSVGLAAAAHVIELQGVYPSGPHQTGTGLHLTGLSTPDQLRSYVDKGVVESFALWAPYNEGYAATAIATQIKAGKLKPAEGVEFDGGKVGKRKFGKNARVFAGESVVFDKATIGNYHF